MRSCFVLGLVASTTIQAQTVFAPIGAKWTYAQGHVGGPDSNIAVIQVVGDTLIDGRSCSVIERLEGWFSCYYSPSYLHLSGDSLLQWNVIDSIFGLVFRWDALPGDTWSTPLAEGEAEEPWRDTLDWVVTDTGHVMIDGSMLRTYTAEVFSRQWVMFASIHEVVERLGALRSPFTWALGFCDAETYRELRCYEDPEFGSWLNPAVVQCDLGTSIPESASDERWQVFPTVVDPGGTITVRVGPGVGDPVIRITDALGREVMMRRIGTEHTATALPTSGMYTVTLTPADGPATQQRVVVR